MLYVEYFRHGRWHKRLFHQRDNAVAYADTFPLTALIRYYIPGY